jgi:hypothetical protein
MIEHWGEGARRVGVVEQDRHAKLYGFVNQAFDGRILRVIFVPVQLEMEKAFPT